MLQEINNEQFNDYINSGHNVCVLIYTNMCGTCESAKVMLKIISETIKDVNYLTINVNLNSTLIQDYNVTSIPCFLLFKKGKLMDQFYAFHSVTFLYDKIKQII